MDKCPDCKKREGVVDFCPDGTTGFIHGFVIKLCRECLIERFEKTIKQCNKQIKEQKELLNAKIN